MKRLLIKSLAISILLISPNLYSADKGAKKSLPSLSHMDRLFFDHNPQFVDIMKSSNTTALKEIEKKRSAALQNYKKDHSYTGLEVDLNGATEVNRHDSAYSTRLSWDLLDSGYFGYKKDAQRDTIKEEIALNKMFHESESDFMKVAMSEIDNIENSIIYHYARKKASFLKEHIAKEKKRVSAGVLSLQSYQELKSIYKKIKDRVNYYKTCQPETFDLSYRHFITNIEDHQLTKLSALKQYAIKHDKTLKSLKLQIEKESSYNSEWVDRISANVYVNQQKYTFLDREDTKVGFRLNVPVDNPSNSKSLSKIKIALYKQKIKSRKQLLNNEIKYIYSKVNFHKNKISSLKSEIAYFQKQLRQIDIKSKHPIPTDEADLSKQRVIKYLHLVDLHQNIWEERCEIIKNYITLQYLVGAKIL